MLTVKMGKRGSRRCKGCKKGGLRGLLGVERGERCYGSLHEVAGR